MSEFVYLILGCKSSGRRYVLFDLLKDMTSETDPFTLLLPEGEEPNEWNDKLAGIGHLTLEYYKGDVNAIAPDQINPHHTNIILSPEGSGNEAPLSYHTSSKISPVGCSNMTSSQPFPNEKFE